ncbi:MAG: hypothetical protein ABIG45_09890 [Bacillota bacterium]
MFVYILIRVGLPNAVVTWLPVCLALWYPLTRVVNGDFYLQESSLQVYYLLLTCCVLFPAAFLYDPIARARLLKTVALAYSLPMGVLAWIACIGAVTGNPWVNPIDTVNILGINGMYAEPYRLNFLGIHPNISSAYLYTALALLLYLFFSTKRIWLRILYLVAGAGMYLAIILAASNAAIGVTGLMIGVTAYAYVTVRMQSRKRRKLIGVLAGIVSFCLVFASYPLLLQTIGANAKHAQQENVPQTEETGDTAEGNVADTAAGNEAPEEAIVVENRLNTAIITIESRMVLFSSAFLSIEERPLTLLIGELQEDAMERSARVISIPLQNHLHNSFLQALVVGGGVFTLLAIAFVVLLVLRGCRLYFGKDVPLNVKLLVLAPMALLCHSMVEALLFIDTRPPNMLFFLLSGMIVAYSSQLCPRKEKQGKNA